MSCFPSPSQSHRPAEVRPLVEESERILKDNYYSLVYARNMLAGLDDMKTAVTAALFKADHRGISDYYGRLFNSGKSLLETNIKAENNNITEIHEKEWVAKLNSDYDSYLKLCLQLKEGAGGDALYLNDFQTASERLRQSINAIYDINMQAVVRKSQMAERDSSRFQTFMAIIGSVCFTLALLYFWFFPAYISATLSYVSDRMKALLKNTGTTLDDANAKDETYMILRGIRVLESQLGVKKED